jgi:hypothetical protein
VLPTRSPFPAHSQAWFKSLPTDGLSQFIRDGGNRNRIFVEALTGRGKSVRCDQLKAFLLGVVSQIQHMTDDQHEAAFLWPYN